jgi:hypothetical protein
MEMLILSDKFISYTMNLSDNLCIDKDLFYLIHKCNK